MRLDSIRERVVRTAQLTLRGLFHHHAFDTAAANAFYFFLSLVPLLAFLGFVLGRVALSQGLDEFTAPLFSVVPRNVARIARDELQRMGNQEGVAPLSIAGFVYFTSSGTHNLMDLLEVTVGAPPRRWWKQRVIAIAWNAAGVVLLAALVWAFVAITVRIGGVTTPFAPPDTIIARVARATFGRAEAALFAGFVTALAIATLALFFRIAVAHPKGVSRHVWPGAIVAVLLGLVVSAGFGVYVARLGQYAVYFGSLATVAVLLMWMYLTSLALLVGAEINAQLEGLRVHLHTFPDR